MLSTLPAQKSAVGSAFAASSERELSSASVRLTYAQHLCPNLDGTLCGQLRAYGEVARIDTTLAGMLGAILVTYFDVRCAQRLLSSFPGHSEPYEAADHDFRAMQLSMPTFTKLANNVGGFAQFGEVANIHLLDQAVVVEFHDMRAAQRLMAATAGSAKPWTPKTSKRPTHLPSTASPLKATAQAFTPLSTQSPFAVEAISWPPGLGDDVHVAKSLATQFFNVDDTETPSSPTGSKPGRTKVTNKEFEKFDIHPEKIMNGRDLRTTIMVRNLAGPNARHDFMKLLEKTGLAKKYMFFYMPCKEHRNVSAGFAFVNFTSPEDVLCLFTKVSDGVWSECVTDQHTKSLVVSYARFQGQEELLKHFSSSAVLREQDPDKRPIFRTAAGDLKDLTMSNRSSPGSCKPSKKEGGYAYEALSSSPLPASECDNDDESPSASPLKMDEINLPEVLAKTVENPHDSDTPTMIGA